MAVPAGIPSEVLEAALQNPKLRARAEQMIERLFDTVDYTLQFGTNSELMALQRAVMPALLRQVQTAQQDAERDAMRREYQELREMLQGLGTQRPTDDDD